jgi:hypothetical protein
MDKTTQLKGSTSDLVADKLVALAEQLEVLVGTVQAKAEGRLDPTRLTSTIGRIQDSAADLLAHLNREDTVLNTPAQRTATSPARRSRGPVDAPGKRHRKPLPQERLDRKTGEPSGKQMGQKNFQRGRRSGRG